MKWNLPKHPLSREIECPVCQQKFSSVPTLRGESPDDHSYIIEQHVCPHGHVFTTDLGKNEMLGQLG